LSIFRHFLSFLLGPVLTFHLHGSYGFPSLLIGWERGLISNYKNGLFRSSILLFCGSFFVSQSGPDLFSLLAGPLDGRGSKKSLLPPGTEWNGTSNKIGRYQVMNSTMTKKFVGVCINSFFSSPRVVRFLFLFLTFSSLLLQYL